MKTRTLALLSLGIITLLVLGTLASNVFSPPPNLKLKTKWKPATYTLDNGPPNPWLTEIYFAPPRPLTEVDPSTLLLEGIYSPSAPVYMHPLKDRLVVPWNGYDVITALLTKVGHMGPGTYVIFLEITGKLYSGQAFSGQGSITLVIPELPPP